MQPSVLPLPGWTTSFLIFTSVNALLPSLWNVAGVSGLLNVTFRVIWYNSMLSNLIRVFVKNSLYSTYIYVKVFIFIKLVTYFSVFRGWGSHSHALPVYVPVITWLNLISTQCMFYSRTGIHIFSIVFIMQYLLDKKKCAKYDFMGSHSTELFAIIHKRGSKSRVFFYIFSANRITRTYYCRGTAFPVAPTSRTRIPPCFTISIQ